LVKIGAKWARNRGNVVVVTELASTNGEEPDVLAFDPEGRSTLIEVKLTRSDFLRDNGKAHSGGLVQRLGMQRYYLTPSGCLTVDELPMGWGLLEVVGTRAMVVKHAINLNADDRREKRLLCSLVQRIGQGAPDGVRVKCYVYSKPDKHGEARATLGVMEENGE